MLYKRELGREQHGTNSETFCSLLQTTARVCFKRTVMCVQCMSQHLGEMSAMPQGKCHMLVYFGEAQISVQ